MDAAPPIHSGRTYTVLVVLLAGLIALGAMLLVLVTGGGSISSASFEVAVPEAVECPFGSGAPVCYRYNVTNTGDAPSFVRCELTPAGDTTAVFGNGSTSYESPIEMGSRRRLPRVRRDRSRPVGRGHLAADGRVCCRRVNPLHTSNEPRPITRTPPPTRMDHEPSAPPTSTSRKLGVLDYLALVDGDLARHARESMAGEVGTQRAGGRSGRGILADRDPSVEHPSDHVAGTTNREEVERFDIQRWHTS